MAQSAERVLGKDEVTGSIPVSSSNTQKTRLNSGFQLVEKVQRKLGFFALIW
jgi:hypothetical protein